MKSLEMLNSERSQHQVELHELEERIIQLESSLGDEDSAATPAAKSLTISIQEARSKVDNIEYKISVIDQGIAWFERKANSSELMAEYKTTMDTWESDKTDLEGKRNVLIVRIARSKEDSERVIAEARQAEETAARAYAQAVAWSDQDGEQKAASEAQEAANSLAMAMENQRRQALTIKAMEEEVEIIDAHINEASQEFLKAERAAVLIALERLEEQWDDSVNKLLEVGAKLYAAKRYMGRDQMAFHEFSIPSQINSFTKWKVGDLVSKSLKVSLPEMIAGLCSIDMADNSEEWCSEK